MNHHDYDHHHHHCCRRHHHQNYQETPFSNDSYPLALTYINWETDAIVGIELIRNVSMALGDINLQWTQFQILILFLKV